jgi:hypothetical protein
MKKKSKFQLVLANFLFRAEWKKVTSRAENPARAMARTSSARTHHYTYLPKTLPVLLG